jgi:diguanylate cyclase (GGDEF)-like protein
MPVDRQKHLARKVLADLTARSGQGVWGHPACMLLVLFTSNLAHRIPLASWSALGVLGILSALRLILLRHARGSFPLCPELWHELHRILVMLSAAVWGLLPAYATYVLGRYDRDTMIVYLFHAAISVGTVTLLIHDLSLIRVALGILFVPSIVVQPLAGVYESWNPILIYAVYTLYLNTTGQKLNHAYWQQISDNHDLAVLAHCDNLTGLPNRLSLNAALGRSLAEARDAGRRVAILFVDFDGFKQINDRYSHRLGDLFLCELAARLRACVQCNGFVARLGGDEFTVLIEDASSDVPAEIAQRVLRVASEPFLIEGNVLTCTASIGISIFPDQATSPDDLLRTADMAMYSAKVSGKNRICFSKATPGLVEWPKYSHNLGAVDRLVYPGHEPTRGRRS